ncbi:MAG TPA: NUDIX domain-containing protein [Streptosporangiaceae bacterium]
MPGPDPIPRRAGRVLPIDSANRVLLLRGIDPADPEHPYWFTVGGGADPGETLAQAADGMDADEKGSVTGYRWCSVADLDALGEPFFPGNCPACCAG